jgi:hypothetical protein
VLQKHTRNESILLKMKGKLTLEEVKAVLGNNVLFFIERSLDNDIVIYEAVREGNMLAEPLVDIFWTSQKDFKRKDPVGKKAQELFFGLKARKMGSGKYQMIVASMPKKIINIHVKPSGRCIAKAVIAKKEARVIKIYVEMSTRGPLNVPTVDALHIYGYHKGVVIPEKIDVDDEMRKRFDVSNFIPNLKDFTNVF